jgi:hypothetical protein
MIGATVEDAGADEAAVAFELHHKHGVGGRGDAPGSELTALRRQLAHMPTRPRRWLARACPAAATAATHSHVHAAAAASQRGERKRMTFFSKQPLMKFRNINIFFVSRV